MKTLNSTAQGSCHGCRIYYALIAEPVNRNFSEEEINRARAMRECGGCIRQPEKVSRYSARNSREDKWIPVNPAEFLVTLSLQSPLNRSTYSPEVLRRIESFWHNHIFKTE